MANGFFATEEWRLLLIEAGIPWRTSLPVCMHCSDFSCSMVFIGKVTNIVQVCLGRARGAKVTELVPLLADGKLGGATANLTAKSLKLCRP
jgi:hypothetical protein